MSTVKSWPTLLPGINPNIAKKEEPLKSLSFLLLFLAFQQLNFIQRTIILPSTEKKSELNRFGGAEIHFLSVVQWKRCISLSEEVENIGEERRYLRKEPLSEDLYIGFGRCLCVCPQQCIELSSIPAEIGQNRCLRCGNWVPVCPTKAISFLG